MEFQRIGAFDTRIMTTSSALSPAPGRDRGAGWRAYMGNRQGCQLVDGLVGPVHRKSGTVEIQLCVACLRMILPGIEKQIVSSFGLYMDNWWKYSDRVSMDGWVMSKLFSSLLFTGTMLALSAETALAWSRPVRGNGNGRGGVHSVPEIDASAGLLALAAVVAIVVFAWERNRRAAA